MELVVLQAKYLVFSLVLLSSVFSLAVFAAGDFGNLGVGDLQQAGSDAIGQGAAPTVSAVAGNSMGVDVVRPRTGYAPAPAGSKGLSITVIVGVGLVIALALAGYSVTLGKK